MRRSRTPILVLLLLVAGCFALATSLEPRVAAWSNQDSADSVFKVLLGDGRRIFANQAFAEADIYFHSGYYPSVFDQAQAPKDSSHMTAQEGSPEEEEHERQMNFLGLPRDWIDRFGRHFLITEHTHLKAGQERELLPWLKLSAELDPQRVEAYTVGAYFLQKHLHKPAEAEEFLREGLRNNPQSYDILYALGRLYLDEYHQPDRARNVWAAALRRWQQQEPAKKKPDLGALDQIAVNLSRVEEQLGDLNGAIEHLELAITASPQPEALKQQVAELKRKLAARQHGEGPKR